MVSWGMSDNERVDAYSVWRIPAYRRYLAGVTLAMAGQAMLTTALGWDLYERTHDPFVLGLVGLAEFLPVVGLALPAGQLADRHDRRRIVQVAMFGLAACALGLAGLSVTSGPIWVAYALVAGAGASQAFAGPARSALLSAMVPSELLPVAATWTTNAAQLAFMTGPAFAGLAIAATGGAATVYGLAALGALAFAILLAGVETPRPKSPNRAPALADLLGGLRFVHGSSLLLAAITLDMIAVLLGGATALLPVFAKDILGGGPTMLGALNAAPAMGAFLTGLVLAHRRPWKRNGAVLLAVIAGFGAATIGFGLATHPAIAWAMLFLVGATDMVSMVIRAQMVQVLTPDAMRGRVAAVHSVFVGTSNELGAFESGAAAAFFGPVRAVVAGGAATIVLVGLVAWRVPALRRMGAIVAPAEPLVDHST